VDGWELLSQQEQPLEVGERRIAASRALMTREGAHLLATYFFTDGEYATRSLARFQGAQLLKRLRAEPPFGASVCIRVPTRGNREAAERLSDDFARAALPTIMESLRRARAAR
jgi:EpsI family protein